MTEEDISIPRSKALAAIGAIGAASAGAGFGTTAYFSDSEGFNNNRLVAGELDLKVAWQSHYSDWMGAETNFAEMPADDQSPDLRLPAGEDSGTEIKLNFRDLPGDNNGTDSTPDESDGVRQFLRNTKINEVNGGLYNSPEDLCETNADVPSDQAGFQLRDVKPGDFGLGLFRFQLCTNPGYLWLTGGLESASENGLTESEADDPDEDGDGDSTDPADVELLDEVQVVYSTGTGDIDTTDPADLLPDLSTNNEAAQSVQQTTLRNFLEMLESGNGIGLSGDKASSGSSAEGTRPDEVSKEEFLGLVDSLADRFED